MMINPEPTLRKPLYRNATLRVVYNVDDEITKANPPDVVDITYDIGGYTIALPEEEKEAGRKVIESTTFVITDNPSLSSLLAPILPDSIKIAPFMFGRLPSGVRHNRKRNKPFTVGFLAHSHPYFVSCSHARKTLRAIVKQGYHLVLFGDPEVAEKLSLHVQKPDREKDSKKTREPGEVSATKDLDYFAAEVDALLLPVHDLAPGITLSPTIPLAMMRAGIPVIGMFREDFRMFRSNGAFLFQRNLHNPTSYTLGVLKKMQNASYYAAAQEFVTKRAVEINQQSIGLVARLEALKKQIEQQKEAVLA